MLQLYSSFYALIMPYPVSFIIPNSRIQKMNTADIYTHHKSVHKNLDSGTNYRDDIDGLRAVAVMSVLIYHLTPTYLPSGFLGVDVFFAISGFVITQSFLTGTSDVTLSSVGNFYARRMWRLLPNLLTCLTVTALVTWLLVPESSESLTAGIFATVGLSNIYFWILEKDYFSQALELNPFMHTWSLGVEEQFYLIFPWLFFTISRFSWLRLRKILFLLSFFIAAASLLAFIYSELYLPPEIRFLMPLRLWELSAGAFTYLLYARLPFGPRHFTGRGKGYFTFLAATAMVIAFLAPAQLRGVTTIISVLATAVLLLLPHDSRSLRAALSSIPASYLGKRSYSLYLWHWPVISISYWTVGVTTFTIPFQLALIFALSLFAFRFIEWPLRNKFHSTNIIRSISIFFVTGVLVSGSIYFLAKTDRILGVRSARQSASEATVVEPFYLLPNTNLPFNPTCVVDGVKRALKVHTFDFCTIPPVPPNTQRLWALGDSHAGHLQGLLYDTHLAIGIGVHIIETPGIPFPMLPGKTFRPREEIWNQIRKQVHPGDIILVSRLFIDRKSHDPAADLGEWMQELVKLSEESEMLGAKLVVVGPPPAFEFKSPSACFLYMNSTSNCDIDRAAIFSGIGKVYDALSAAVTQSGGKIAVFNTFSLLCPPEDEVCSPFKDGKLFMRDADHLNVFAGQILKAPFVAFLRDQGIIPFSPISAGGSLPSGLKEILFSERRYPDFVTSIVGLSVNEPQGRWSDAHINRSVQINFASSIPEGTTIRLTVLPLGPNENKPLTIKVGKSELQRVLVPGNNTIEFSVGKTTVGVNSIEFIPYSPVTPLSLGINKDVRLLAIRLTKLELIPPVEGTLN